MQVKIGPHHRIADEHGTHEPGEVVNWPSDALVELARAGTKDDEGVPYVEIFDPAKEAA